MTDFLTPGRVRPRRLRRSAALRELVAETRVSASQLMMPHFVLPARHGLEPCPASRAVAPMIWCVPSATT